MVIKDNISQKRSLRFGVPQGSVLGTILFLIYFSPLSKVIEKHGLGCHGFADDAQMLIHFDMRRFADLENAIFEVEQCCSNVNNWMIVNRLKVSCEKPSVVYRSSFSFLSSRIFQPSIFVEVQFQWLVKLGI